MNIKVSGLFKFSIQFFFIIQCNDCISNVSFKKHEINNNIFCLLPEILKSSNRQLLKLWARLQQLKILPIAKVYLVLHLKLHQQRFSEMVRWLFIRYQYLCGFSILLFFQNHLPMFTQCSFFELGSCLAWASLNNVCSIEFIIILKIRIFAVER